MAKTFALFLIGGLFILAACGGTSGDAINDGGAPNNDDGGVTVDDGGANNDGGAVTVDSDTDTDTGAGADVGTTNNSGTGADAGPTDDGSSADGDEASSDGGGGGGGSSGAGTNGDIEKWLIEVGNDFPESARCVATEMAQYSVADFEASFRGEASEAFEIELDAVYEMCDALFGITSEE